MAMLTVAARLFRNRAHAEISTSQQVHAGCGQLVGGLAALALAIALLASRTSRACLLCPPASHPGSLTRQAGQAGTCSAPGGGKDSSRPQARRRQRAA